MPTALNHKIALLMPSAASVHAIEAALTKKKVAASAAKAESEQIALYIAHYLSAASPYFDRQSTDKKAIKSLSRFVSRCNRLKKAPVELDPSDRLQIELLASARRWLRPSATSASQELPSFATRPSETSGNFMELVDAYALAGKRTLKEATNKKSKTDGARAKRLLTLVAGCWRVATGELPAHTDDANLGMPKFVKLIRDAAESVPDADAKKVSVISGYQLEKALHQLDEALADEPTHPDE